MNLEVDTRGDVTIVRVREDRLVYPVLGGFYARVSRLVEEGTRKLVIDLAAVEYVDSATIGCLMDVHRLLEERAGALRLAGLTERVATMVGLTGLDRLVDVFDEAGAAAESFT